ncbi:response regulator transcription factor [Clostridium estertheticum]|uniref:response regulator transcription factor n=1 Tax=Clostridium estertheticum TaxID=238834 RepID=UPI001C0E6E19|nr:response regulator transcription factor [Clostridium estertheticum]MBU3216771.1 response regulator transcription factor [Clostridium estertheticum]WAG54265.1 response regulator transcription factor [Clostridium estertheticum]
MEKIIIVEDDEIIREELEKILTKYGYKIIAPLYFDNIVESIINENANLVLLDINLPVFDGYYICREIRKKSNVPIIIVTSRDSDMDELMSMNLGADDFVTKPYNIQILMARISALLKRSSNKEPSSVLTCKDFQVNLSNATLLYDGKEIELTKNEVKILSYLIIHKGEIISRDLLMEQLWKSDYFIDDRTLTVNITRLRKKLEEAGLESVIETRRGLGYIIS